MFHLILLISSLIITTTSAEYKLKDDQRKNISHLALVYHNNVYKCYATIISQNLVLTATSCVLDVLPKDIYIEVDLLASSTNNNQTTKPSGSTAVIPISKQTVSISSDRKYNIIKYRTYLMKYTLLVTDRPIIFNKYVNAVKLPSESNNNLILGSSALISGFLGSKDHLIDRQNFSTVSVQILSDDECNRNEYQITLDICKNLIYLGFVQNATRIDLGSPVLNFNNNKNGDSVLIGIVDLIIKNSDYNSTLIITKVTMFLSFINNEILKFKN